MLHREDTPEDLERRRIVQAIELLKERGCYIYNWDLNLTLSEGKGTVWPPL